MSKYNKDDLPSSQYYKKILSSTTPAVTNQTTNKGKCQKCNQVGHWSYQCTNEQTYLYRPSRTKQLTNPIPLSGAAPPPEPSKTSILDSVLSSVRPKKVKRRRRRSTSSSSSSDSDSSSSNSSNRSKSPASKVSSNSGASSVSSSSSSESSDSSSQSRRRRRRRH